MEVLQLKNFSKVLDDFANEFADLYKSKLIGVNSSYELSNSVELISVVENNNKYKVIFKALSYWENIEFGREVGKSSPPIDSILRWIEIKPIIPYPYNGKLPTNKQLAYLISRSIKEKGISPKPILKDTLTELVRVYTPLFTESIKSDLNNEITFILNVNKLSKPIIIKT